MGLNATFSQQCDVSRRWAGAWIVMIVLILASAAMAEAPYPIAWTRQIGISNTTEWGFSVALDQAGNAYVGGSTDGNFGGWCNGLSDAFLTKYDSSGNPVWKRQMGGHEEDVGYSVAVDSTSSIYLNGMIYGNGFLARYDNSGNQLWSRQFGQLVTHQCTGVAVDGLGNAYCVGTTQDRNALLVKYDNTGNLLWSRSCQAAPIPSSGDTYCHSVAIDRDGNAYITGETCGSFYGTNAGSTDPYLMKYDPMGNLLWSRQSGSSSYDMCNCVTVDADGNSYITGSTTGNLGGPNGGSFDCYVMKYDRAGNLLWTGKISTANDEESRSVTVDANGNVFIAGVISGNDYDAYDAFLAKFDGSGNKLWQKIFDVPTPAPGFNVWTTGYSVTVDSDGNPYVSGTTYDLYNRDAFLVKFEVPEPATISLLAAGVLLMLRRRRTNVES